MATTTTARVLSHLRRWLNHSCPSPDTDTALVRRFVEGHDESAFAALVDRHGPMVLGVARRVVGDHHTAEDIFQATFLTLARRASQLRRPAALPIFLHQTAYHLAVTALRAGKRREKAEAEVIPPVSGSPLDDLSSRELLAILDEELGQLPEAYRLPLLLCCLEGRSQDEAAAMLGWSPGSVKGRLERGRQRLKERLARRGLTFAIGAGVPLLATSPSLASSLRDAALQAVRDGGRASATAAALTDAAACSLLVASRRMLLVVVAVGLIGVGIALAFMSVLPGQTADSPVAAADEPPPAPRADPDGAPLPEGAVRCLGSPRLRIGNSAFALTPDGRTIVTCSPEGIVREFDAGTGRLLRRRQLGDRSDVSPGMQCHAQLSADGRRAAIDEELANGWRVTVWDVPSGQLVFRRASDKGGEIRDRYLLSPDGKQLALDDWTDDPRETQIFRVYDLGTGKGKDLGTIERNVYGIYFTADSKRILVSQTSAREGGDGATFACFDVPAGKQLWRLPRKGQTFAVSPDGKILLAAGFKGGFQAIEIDPESGRPTERFQPDRRAHPNAPMVIAPDNRTVFMYLAEVIVWDFRTGEEIRRLPISSSWTSYGPILGAIAPDSRSLVTNIGHLQRWDLSTGKSLFQPPPDDGLAGPVERLAFTADGQEVFASSWSGQTARWQVATGKRVAGTKERYGHQIVSTPAGLRVLRTDTQRRRDEKPPEVTLVDGGTGKPLQTVRWGESDEAKVRIVGHPVYSLTKSGKTLLVASWVNETEPPKSRVIACDVASGRRLAQFIAPGLFSSACPPFSPCGRWIVLGRKVYHVGTGTELFTPTGESGEQLLLDEDRWTGPTWFSEDGRLLAGVLEGSGGNKRAPTDTLAVWELASGKMLVRFPKGKLIGQVAFASNGRTLAWADGWGVHLHDLSTGKRLAAYSAPDVPAHAMDGGWGAQTLAFAPDGQTLATGHQDGTVLLWHVPRLAEEEPAALPEAERETLWSDLASSSASKGRDAVDRLARRPTVALELLKARFTPSPTPADPTLPALLKDLDSNEFATREQADRKLRDLGIRAELILRQALAGNPSPEMKRRIEGILEAMPGLLQRLPLSGDALRGVRAIEVLERVGTPKARTLLQAWAEQSRDLRLAAEARSTLERKQ